MTGINLDQNIHNLYTEEKDFSIYQQNCEEKKIDDLLQKHNQNLILTLDELKDNETQQSQKQYLKAVESEQKALQALSKMNLYIDLHIFNVNIKLQDGSIQWIHTYKCGDKNEKALVLIHGYGGSSLSFYRILKSLSETYQVYAIDILGFGLSSRPQFNLTDPTEINDYFVDFLEKWRIELNIKDLYLCGHSFGGYIASQYALKKQQNLKNLILLSPAGGTHITAEECITTEQHINQNLSYIGRQFFKVVKKAYEYKYTPTDIYNSYFLPSKYFATKYLQKRLKLQENEVNLWKNYLQNMFAFPVSTEKAFHSLFQFPKVAAFHSLEEHFPDNLKIKVHFFFGDNDWMDSRGAKRLIYENLVSGSFNIVENAGHQMIFENPERLTYLIKQLAK